MESILKPLGEKLSEFKTKVEETYDKESKQRFSLEERIRELVALNHQISEDANNLTKALKGNNKIQGNWGEMILESILEKSGLRKYFQHTVSSSEVGKSKPEPDVFLHAAKLLGVAPENCVVFEDSKNGIKAAKAAGMFCIAYSGANSGEQDRSHADLQIDNYDELKNFNWERIYR